SRDYFVKAGLLARRLPHLPPVRPRPRVAHVSAEADCANLHVRRRVWIAHLLQDPHGQLEGCFRWRHLCTPFLTSSASREGSSVTRTRFQPGSFPDSHIVSSLVQVAGPTIPSTVSEAPSVNRWKFLTICSVAGPNTPSS